MSWHGQFCWYELMAGDLERAADFYGMVMGWQVTSADMPGADYRLFGKDGQTMAGLIDRMEGGPQGWIAYVAVDDADHAASAAKASGAAIHRGPADIPGVGRFAIMSDPQGALLAMLQPAPTDTATPPDLYDAPGRCGWHELRVPDWKAAWSFYEPLFGWKKGGTVEMGPAGTYQLFGPASLGRDFGGMMDGETPGWRYYFNVDALEAAIGRVESGGGSLVHGPTEVPGGSWVAVCRDPEGSTFALTAGGR